ncbi:MAG: putative immunity protein [Candidatus Dormibacteraceae bacterium]
MRPRDTNSRRVLAGRGEWCEWAAGCAERTLALFETGSPDDVRPRDAIEGARAFARGELRIGAARALAAQAHAAAREVADPAAVAAARAAGHAVAVAHMASHALGGPACAARAAALAARNNPSAGADIVGWAERQASSEVRGILRRLPPRTRAPGPLGAVLLDLQRSLTDEETAPAQDRR